MKIDKELLLEKQRQYTNEFGETIHKLNNPFCNTPHLGGEIISIEAKLSLIEELHNLLEEESISESDKHPTIDTDDIKELLLNKQKQYTKELNNPNYDNPQLGGKITFIKGKLSLIEELLNLLKENPETEKTNEIEKELTNIKNLSQDMENIVKKDITEDILTLEKELLDLQFEYDKAILEKISELEDQVLKNRGGAGIGDYNPGYFEIHARMLCLPLLRKIYDKQYEIKALEHKAIQNIQQTMR